MFSKENKIEKFKDAETIIGPSIKVKGNFNGKGDIVIEGILEGSLKTDANVFIGEKARVNANIEASEAFISGEISGNIKIKKYLAIGKSAKITGDVQCGEISIERGALIGGQIIVAFENNKKNDDKKTAEVEV
ncbi:MAG: polymer-forming cytoskeletal protein [Patescibacteria group bacterium]|jgi:cytoskeletal protein CcmA (bactofilin family)|nr:polymer-forming cytoskeletal protein [Patescibacteria group bacterium]